MSEPMRSSAVTDATDPPPVDGAGFVEDGAFVTATEELATAFGYDDPESLVGRPWRDLYPEAQREDIESEVLPQVHAGGEWCGEVVGRRADGSSVLHLASIRGDGVGRLVWVVRDLGRDAESTPPEADAEGVTFRPLFETAPLPAIVFTPDRGIVYGNEAAVELVGTDGRDDLLGREPTGFVHPDQREKARNRIRHVLDEWEPSEPTEYRLVPLDGEEKHVEIAAAPLRHDGTPAAYLLVNDVTSLRRTQEQLRRERRFVETVIDAVEDRRVELDVRTEEGETIEHEFRGTTVEDPETGVVSRRGIARDVSERLDRERRLERYETLVETIDDGIYALDEDFRFSFVNERLCEMLGRSRGELLGRSVRDLFAFDDELEFADEVRRRVVEGDANAGSVRGTYPTDDGDRIFESRYRLLPVLDGEFQGSVGVVRDVTDHEERKRALENNLDELETLDRINRILRETTRELVETADRGAIERIVCAQLVASDLYEFAWVGERTFDGDHVVPRTTAGDDRGYLDAVGECADGTTVVGGPAGLAMRSGDVRVATPESPGGCPWPDPASECGFGSIAAVPLHHEGTVFGVLVVQTTREDAFGDRVLDDLDVLGRTVGFVINAVRSHELLFTDGVVEFELHLSGEESTLGTIASAVEAELELAGYVASGQHWILYVDVDGGRPEDVVGLAADDPTVEQARVVRTNDAGGRLELVVETPSLVPTVSNAGASIRSVSADPRGVRLIAEAPVDAEVRELVEPIRREFPDTTLEARRDRDREVITGNHPEGVLGDLTDRQREALEAAYRAGYFAWPRDSTANEIAESLDLASATLHGHLRKAEATILSTVFDGE